MSSTVDIFVHWLYTQALPGAGVLDYLKWEQVIAEPMPGYIDHELLLVQAYSFGDRFLVPAFRRVANNLFVEMMDEVTLHGVEAPRLIHWAFQHIPADCAILQLLVDQFYAEWNSKDNSGKKEVTEALITLPPKIFIRMVRYYDAEVKFLFYTTDKSGFYAKRCYLEHATAEEKARCGKEHVHYDEEGNYGYFE